MSLRTKSSANSRRSKRLHRNALCPRLEALERRDLLAGYTTPEDTTLVVTDSALASLFVVKQPEHGTVSRTNVGGFAYVPAKDYFGPDRFTYSLATSATPANVPGTVPGVITEVAIEVTPVNDPPQALNDEYSTLRNTELSIPAPGVLKNDKDVDSAELKSTLVKQAEHGIVELADNGSFKYTPAAGYTGPDSFLYRASDGLAPSNEAKVFLNVRSLPDARDDQYSAVQNGVLTVPPRGVLTNDIGLNDRGLLASLEPGDDNKPKHGTVELKADGSFTYKPNPGYYGPDNFVYRATDNTPALSPTDSTTPLPAAFDIAKVHIYVRPNPIVRANADVYTTVINTKLAVAAPGVLKNDYVLYMDAATGTNAAGTSVFAPSAPLYATLITPPSSGQLALKENGSFEYVPKEGFVGAVTFTYQAKLPATLAGPNPAENNTDPSTQRLDIATVTINVVRPPLPDAQDDHYRLLEGTTLTVAAPGVLANDGGATDRALIAKLNTRPRGGELIFNENGSFTYAPRSGFSGYDSFTYFALGANDEVPTPTAADSNTNPADPALPRPINLATVTLYVQPRFPRVYALNDDYRVLTNTTLEVAAPGVLKNDKLIPPPAILEPHANTTTTDPTLPIPIPPTNVKVTAKLLTEPAHGTLSLNENGSFKYTPAAGFVGEDKFSYQALSTIVLPAPDSTTADSLMTVTTVGGAPCELYADGTAICPPVEIDDIAVVRIRVTRPEPPVVARDDAYQTAANTKLEIRAPGVLANDSAAANDLPSPANVPGTISRPLVAQIVAQPTHGTLVLRPNGSFEYQPDANFVGIDTFQYRAALTTTTDPATGATSTDATPVLDDIATVTIRVVAALARNDEYSTLQNVQLDVRAPGVLTNDAGGSDEHPLAALLVSAPLHGRLELDSTGAFVYKPNPNFTGTDIFVYRATTGLSPTDPPTTDPTTAAAALAGDSSTNDRPLIEHPGDVAIVKIYVRAAQSTVQAYPDKYATPQNVVLAVPAPGVFANDYALVNHRIEASLAEGPAHGTVVVNADGSFAYTPSENFVGEDKFVYKATDLDGVPSNPAGTTNVSFATVFIRVHQELTPPRFIPGENLKTTDESGRQQVAEWATLLAVTADGQRSFTVTTDQPQLFVAPPSIDATGQLTYTPAPNVRGTAQVTVALAGDAAASTTTFTIEIDKPHPLFNAANACDVNDNGDVKAGDALAIINHINAFGVTRATAAEGENAASELPAGLYLDVTKDNLISAADALMVINYLNAGLGVSAASAEGESAAATDLSLLALMDDFGEPKRKRA